MADIGTTVGLIKALAPKPDAESIAEAVGDWLDDHPEATTTVEDGTITRAKLASGLEGDITGIEQSMNGMGGFIGYPLNSPVKTGRFYKNNNGVLDWQNHGTSVYTDVLDVSSYKGQKLVIIMETYSPSGIRLTGFCNSSNEISTSYDEAALHELQKINADGKLEAELTITDDRFFFSYPVYENSNPVVIIPKETRIYTKSETDNISNTNYEMALNGKLSENIDGYFQRATEKRIWYRAGRLNDGWTIKTTNSDFDVSTYVSGYTNGAWVKSLVIDNSTEYVGICIRKSDLSDISGMTDEQVNDLIDYSLTSNVNEGTHHAHFSFDDCLFWKNLIDNENTYTSAFDEPFLSDLKGLHEKYGAVFTLMCFCEDDGYSISNVPGKFKSDFGKSKDWLKFAFHSQDDETDYSTDKVEQITLSYNTFVTAIIKMTGSIDCIDHVARLGFFTGTLNNVKAIRDCDCGVVGLLTADDTRASYYFDENETNFMLKHAKMFDAENQIMFIKSQARLDSVENGTTYCANFATAQYGNMAKYLEIFMHEYSWSQSKKQVAEAVFDWFKANNYRFVFWDDVFNL